MLPRSDVTPALARFVVETRWEDIPARARHEAKRALLNFFAVALAGCRTEPVELALRTLAAFSGGNVFDYCDTHLPTVVHPTAPLAPALLALSDMRPVSGPAFLLAFVLGFE